MIIFRVLLITAMLGTSSVEALPSSLERIDFLKLDKDSQGIVGSFVQTPDLNNLMATNHEIHKDLLPVKASRVINYNVTKATQQEKLFYYLQQAEAHNLPVSLKLEGATDEDIKALADYSTIIKYLDLNRPLKKTGVLNPLPKLRYLSRGTQVRDNNLTSIRKLNLCAMQVDKMTALSNFLQLQTLNLRGTDVSDISFLSSLLQLQKLNVSCTSVSDISVLGNLPQLQKLNVSCTSVSDISVLSSLLQLQKLNVSCTSVSDVSVLGNLPQLQKLNVSCTSVSDISFLSSLLQLQKLNVSCTSVSDISVLGNLPQLQKLNVSGTQVKDTRELRAKNQNLEIYIPKLGVKVSF